MLLSEDKFVVDSLKKILEDYESLKYDEVWSRGMDYLVVAKENPTEKIDLSIAHRISEALGNATNRTFLNPTSAGSGSSRNPYTDWSSFKIREHKKT